MYIISYDIENNRIRNKIAKELENYGARVQFSVFECKLSEKLYNELYSKLVTLMQEEKSGNIRIYHICAKCEARISTIGVKQEPFNLNLCDVSDLDDLFIV